MNFLGLLYTRDEVVKRDEAIAALDAKLVQAEKDIIARDVALSSCSKTKQETGKELGAMQVRLLELGDLSEDEKAIQEFWDLRHPRATVLYKGGVRNAQGGVVELSLPASTWITPNAFFKAQLFALGLTLEQYLVKHKGVDRFYVYDKLAFDIKALVDARRKYVTDAEKWGRQEVYTYPIETWFLGEGDCEDWAHLTASLWFSAGLPSYRARCVAGVAVAGYGHNTTYWLGRDNKWHHLNSTSRTKDEYDDVIEAPEAGSLNDAPGIKQVWFSYNDQSMWHEFETPADAEAFAAWNKDKRVVLK